MCRLRGFLCCVLDSSNFNHDIRVALVMDMAICFFGSTKYKFRISLPRQILLNVCVFDSIIIR